MSGDEFAQRIEGIRHKLYKTALFYIVNETAAVDLLDETVYKALKSYKMLRQPQFFDTWVTRILINECHREQKRQKRHAPLDELTPSYSSEWAAPTPITVKIK